MSTPTPLLVIYSPHITNRVSYVMDLIFNNLLQTPFVLTDHEDVYLNSQLPKISYGTIHDGIREVSIPASRLLRESNIVDREITGSIFKGINIFFGTTGNYTLPFDLFGASFYLVTRYEEYTKKRYDEHGRFKPRKSLLYKEQTLEQPLVNQYAHLLRLELREMFPDIVIPDPVFTYEPTVDVDMAFSYLGKGKVRNIAGLIRSFFLFDFEIFTERMQVLKGQQNDPFETFDYIEDTLSAYGYSPKYFILLGNYGKHDKNVPHTHPRFRSLIKSLSERNEVHAHLSYGSHKIPEIIEKERGRLQSITGMLSTKNRFHYLKFYLPDSYRVLLNENFTDDYSMGYASRIGFRAGIASPFKWYDLEKDEATILTIHPITAMDATVNFYMKLKPEAALMRLKNIMKTLKECGGTFSMVWHNSNLTDRGDWIGWREVFEKLAKAAASTEIEEYETEKLFD